MRRLKETGTVLLHPSCINRRSLIVSGRKSDGARMVLPGFWRNRPSLTPLPRTQVHWSAAPVREAEIP